VELVVQIVRFVSWEPQPGIVACEFVDAENRSHTVLDKIPTFTAVNLDEQSEYPQRGAVRCEVISEWKDAEQRNLARIITYGVETTDGLSEFIVSRDQLRSPGA
jgi:hypothetical protein